MTKQKKWEVKLRDARTLKDSGAAILFDRVVLLVECYEDDGFRAWCEETGVAELDFLDRELEDTAASFLTLRAVLENYPNKDSWQKHNIRDLIAEVLEAEKKSRKQESSDRISWKERCLAAEKECERLRGELTVMQKTLEIFGTKINA